MNKLTLFFVALVATVLAAPIEPNQVVTDKCAQSCFPTLLDCKNPAYGAGKINDMACDIIHGECWKACAPMIGNVIEPIVTPQKRYDPLDCVSVCNSNYARCRNPGIGISVSSPFCIQWRTECMSRCPPK
jgi:hypothetical protein